MAGRRGEYLFKRPGSQNWWLRLQYPADIAAVLGTDKLQVSLGTPDKRLAMILAAPRILVHKKRLFLHAVSIEFTLEQGRTPYLINAPLSEDLSAVLDRLA